MLCISILTTKDGDNDWEARAMNKSVGHSNEIKKVHDESLNSALKYTSGSWEEREYSSHQFLLRSGVGFNKGGLYSSYHLYIFYSRLSRH